MFTSLVHKDVAVSVLALIVHPGVVPPLPLQLVPVLTMSGHMSVFLIQKLLGPELAKRTRLLMRS